MKNKLGVGRFEIHRKLLKKSNRKASQPFKNRGAIKSSIICDDDYWTEIKTCCGIMYENKLINALLIDSQNINVCARHKPLTKLYRANQADHLQFTKKPAIPVSKGDMFLKRKTDLKFFANNDTIKAKSTITAITYRRPKFDTTRRIGNQSTDDSSQTKTNFEVDEVVASHSEQFTIKKTSESSKCKGSTEITFANKNSSTKNICILNSPRTKGFDLNVAKNIINLNNDTIKCNMKLDNVPSFNDKLIEAIGHKFNDNSSDSGYDEILQEPNNVRTQEII